MLTVNANYDHQYYYYAQHIGLYMNQHVILTSTGDHKH